METRAAQRDVVRQASSIYREVNQSARSARSARPALALQRELHVEYLRQILSRDKSLPKSFACLNAGRPWICYWAVHGLFLLGAIDELVGQNPDDAAAMVSFLDSCQNRELGGFGGGLGQLPHLATTYAAVSALVTLGTDRALSVIDRPKLMGFLLRMCRGKEDGGGMTRHDGGEVDVRGCYCALCVCHMLGMDGRQVVDACEMGDFVRRCQGHEGGIGGEPGNEGHGGYAFCAYGALALAEANGWLPGGKGMIDRGLLVAWVTRMQGNVEGGMRGRTNKLVDGCYSMWQGGLCRLLGADSIASPVGVDESIESTAGSWVEESAVLDAAVSEWCRYADDGRGRATALEAELDEVMERFLVAEERCLADPSDPVARSMVEKLGQDSLRLQNDLVEMEEDLQCAEDSNRCLAQLSPGDGAYDGPHGDQLLDANALQMWILLACQVPDRGGLRDKPGTRPDFYHSCYCLSGLAAMQAIQARSDALIGGDANRLQDAHPICNVGLTKIDRSIAFFKGDHDHEY